MYRSLLTFFPDIASISIPTPLESYRSLFVDELKWVLTTLDQCGRHRSKVSKLNVYVVFAIDRVCRILTHQKRLKYISPYEICRYYQIKESRYYELTRTFGTYLQKYQKILQMQ